MAFKMKGFSLHGGTDKHKDATEAVRKAKLAKRAAKMHGMGLKDRPQPTYEGTDEFRKEKDIPKSEFKKRGVKAPNKALVGKQKNIDVNNNGKIDGDDFKKLKGKSPNKAGCASTPAKKYKKSPSKFIAKAAGMLIGANKQRQAQKDAAEQAKQKGIEQAMSRKL
tara:strand:+ start:129 stop:623 length:495 start_codon:yes stop_codon:yes gene_type:complete